MGISVNCVCGKSYRVQDDAAGKKFRCKSCQQIVKVPAAEDADDFEFFDDSDYERDDDLGASSDFNDPYSVREPRPKKSQKKSKKKRRVSAGDGMPGSVIGACICIGLLMCLTLLGVFGNLMALGAGQQIPLPNGFVAGQIFGMCIRLLIQGAIIWAFFQRQSSARIISMIMGGLGILIDIGMIISVNAGNLPGQQVLMNDVVRTIVIIVSFVEGGLRLANIICLLMPSAAEYFDS